MCSMISLTSLLPLRVEALWKIPRWDRDRFRVSVRIRARVRVRLGLGIGFGFMVRV